MQYYVEYVKNPNTKSEQPFNLLINGKHKLEFHACNDVYVCQLAIKEHICYITSNTHNRYTPPIFYITHVNMNMWKPMWPFLHSTWKSKCMMTLENYYIHYFHQQNMIIKEQDQKEKIPYSH